MPSGRLNAAALPERRKILTSYTLPKSSTLTGVVQSVVYELVDTPQAFEKFNKVFRLLDLNTSLRNRIYSHCLVSPKSLHICRDHQRDRTVDAARDFTTRSGYWTPRVNLLATCKQVHSEATPLLYSLNDFSSIFVDDWMRFLKKMGPSVQYLRQVRLFACRTIEEQTTILKLLEGATSLQSLTLDSYFRGTFPEPTDLVGVLLPMLQKIHSIRKVSNDNKAAINIVELLPEEIGGRVEFNTQEVRAVEMYRVEMQRLLKEVLS